MATTPTPTPEQVAATSAAPTAPVPATPPVEARQDLYQRTYGQPEPPPGDTALLERIAALEQRLATPATPAEAPKVPAWVTAIQMGDFARAEEALAESLRARVGNEFVRAATVESTALMQARNTMEQHRNAITVANPDLNNPVVLGMLDADVARKMEALEAQGQIKSYEMYVSKWKETYDAAVKAVREFVDSRTAAGKQSAMTTRREVISSTTLPPSSIEANRTPQAPPQPPTFADILAARRARVDAIRGLAPTQV